MSASRREVGSAPGQELQALRKAINGRAREAFKQLQLGGAVRFDRPNDTRLSRYALDRILHHSAAYWLGQGNYAVKSDERGLTVTKVKERGRG